MWVVEKSNAWNSLDTLNFRLRESLWDSEMHVCRKLHGLVIKHRLESDKHFWSNTASVHSFKIVLEIFVIAIHCRSICLPVYWFGRTAWLWEFCSQWKTYFLEKIYPGIEFEVEQLMIIFCQSFFSSDNWFHCPWMQIYNILSMGWKK